ncbi:MAG: AmmeMemoRadiSam system protein A [Treponema sp.]|nr:AmmeMemoRadiSam system protein A [Treponema sp.]
MGFTLTTKEQNILLADAREAITAALERRKPSFHQIDEQSVLNTPCGAFVSLHKGRDLRGCIGRMTALDTKAAFGAKDSNLPLFETVRLMAKEAAFGDPRFPPLNKEELNICHIEVSALSPMTLCHDPMLVKVGTHGLYLTASGRSGVLLPQVPVEQGWTLHEYLEYICIKAGLPPGSYKTPNAQLYTFTAIIFTEK